ncbi:Protein of unknown function, partial [Gryllus bimaculatus]
DVRLARNNDWLVPGQPEQKIEGAGRVWIGGVLRVDVAASRVSFRARINNRTIDNILEPVATDEINMEPNIERECSALGGLFQQIIADMKILNSFPTLYEMFPPFFV